MPTTHLPIPIKIHYSTSTNINYVVNRWTPIELTKPEHLNDHGLQLQKADDLTIHFHF